jgi:hypothetical protein
MLKTLLKDLCTGCIKYAECCQHSVTWLTVHAKS